MYTKTKKWQTNRIRKLPVHQIFLKDTNTTIQTISIGGYRYLQNEGKWNNNRTKMPNLGNF